MGYSIDPISRNCYPGTSILINKFDIRDAEMLSCLEATIVSEKYLSWLRTPKCETFDFAHYKSIHCYLFSDLYDWAGQIRTVDMSKKGTAFVNVEHIEEQAEAIFERLKRKSYFRKLSRRKYIDEIVDFYDVLNILHPFREGNGRTQRVFLTQLIRSAGYNIDFRDIDPDLLMIASIQSAHGVYDLLRSLFAEHIV